MKWFVNINIWHTIIIGIYLSILVGQWLVKQDENQCNGKNPEITISSCSAIIKSGRGKAGHFNNRGNAYLEKKMYDLAIQDLNQAVSLEPDNAIILNSRGNAFIFNKSYDQALPDLDKAIRIKPDYSHPFVNRGIVYANKGENEKAIQDFDKAISLEPNSILAFASRSMVYIIKGENEKAIQDLDRVAEFIKDDPNLLTVRGILKFYAISPASTINDFTTAIKINANPLSVIWLHLARIATNQDDQKEFEQNGLPLLGGKWPAPILALYLDKTSIEDVRTQARIGDKDTQLDQNCDVNFYVGKLYLQKNMKKEAKSLFQAAEKGCPVNSVEKNMARIELAK